jgi:excinuclease UvrABC ATPase subunit
MAGSIHVRGAREHNLKNVDVVIGTGKAPKDLS